MRTVQVRLSVGAPRQMVICAAGVSEAANPSLRQSRSFHPRHPAQPDLARGAASGTKLP